MLTKLLGITAGVSILALIVVSQLLLSAHERAGELEHSNATLQATVEATSNRLAEYALDVEGQVAAYATANDYLLRSYQDARDEADNVKTQLAQHDLGALLRAKPGLVVDAVNAGTRRVLLDVEAASRGAAAGQTGAARAPAAASP